MYKFILLSDFQSIATEEDLAVLSDSNNRIIESCNKIAIDEAISYLSVKYDVVSLFKDPLLYSSGTQYVEGDRIYKIVEASPAEDYIVHYTCIKDLPAISPFPSITDTEYFTEEDDRDQKLLEACMSISLFYIHKRLSPNNIPTFRIVSYDGNGNNDIMSAVKWLNLVKDGKLVPYNWPENVTNVDTEIDVDGDGIGDYSILGSNPAKGMMWGNDMGSDYIWYNNLTDPNINEI